MTSQVVAGPTGVVVELEFELPSPAYPFVGITEGTGATTELAEMIPREDDAYAEYFTVSGVSPERVVETAAAHDSLEVTTLRTGADGGLFEFLVSDGCPAVALAERGALPRTATASDGRGRIVAEVPPSASAGGVIDGFTAAHPAAELVAKRQKEAVEPRSADGAAEALLGERLTDRQREVLRTAFEAGYFAWPRETTGAAVAEQLGISSATFCEHVQAAERAMLVALFGEREE